MAPIKCDRLKQLFLYPKPELVFYRRSKAYIPWWEAYLSGDYEFVEAFTGLGIDPEERCPESYSMPGMPVGGHTFLELAACPGNFLQPSTYVIGQTLIKLGAKVNAVDRSGKTLLHKAICSGNSLCVQLLLENGARMTGFDCRGSPGLLALSVSCGTVKENDVPVRINEVLRVLFKHGIDPRWRDQMNSNLLHNLIYLFTLNTSNLKYDIVEIAKTLVEAGVPLEDVNDDSFTPLHLAIHVRKDLKLTACLIEKGANVHKKTALKYSPVEQAVRYDADKIVEFFLDRGINKVNDRFSNGLGNGSTLLHVACFDNRSNVVGLLLRRGADVSPKDNNGTTPFSLLNLNDNRQTESVTYMLKEFSKASFENKKICEEDWQLVSKHHSTLKIFKGCKKELEKMSSVKFYGSHTYFEVLKMSKAIKKLANLAKDDNFGKNFWSKLNLFKFFKDDLKIIFERAIKRKDESLGVYSRLKTIFNDFLPEVVLRNMTDYLRIKDLPLTK